MNTHVLTLQGSQQGLIANAAMSSPAEADAKSDRAKNRSVGPKRKQSLEYWLLIALTYPAFLAAATFETLIPSRLTKLDLSDRNDGLLKRAWLSAHRCIAYAFMG